MGEAKKLFTNSAIVFTGTIIASVFSYLFNMIMGRMLGPAKYGEMTAILSVLTIMSVATGAIVTISMRYSGELYHQGHYRGLVRLIKIFSRYILFLALTFFILGVALSKPIAQFFSISSIPTVLIAFTSFFFGFIIMLNKGILQGTQKFLPLTWVNIAEMLFRLILSVILVKIGFELNGAILATVLATALAFLFTLKPIGLLKAEAKKDQNNEEFQFNKKEIISYSLPTFFVTLLLVIAINIDVILVKHYFPPHEAGLYAAISTIGKILLYLTSPIISVMFPMISERKTKGLKHFRIFFLSVAFTAIGSLLILGIYTVAPSIVIKILYGNSYISYYYLLPQVGVFILFYALSNLISNYFLAIQKFVFVWFWAIILLLQTVLISFWHGELVIVVRILLSTNGLLFALLIGYYLFTKRQQLSDYFKGVYESED